MLLAIKQYSYTTINMFGLLTRFAAQLAVFYSEQAFFAEDDTNQTRFCVLRSTRPCNELNMMNYMVAHLSATDINPYFAVLCPAGVTRMGFDVSRWGLYTDVVTQAGHISFSRRI